LYIPSAAEAFGSTQELGLPSLSPWQVCVWVWHVAW
jgi:hypothetical protein